MEMCYDGTLVMPSSYTLMDEEEMTYVEGGSLDTLKANLRGIYSVVVSWMSKWMAGATIGQALARAGLSWSAIGRMAGSYSRLAAKVVGIISAVTKWLGAHAWLVGAVAGVAGFTLLWNVRIF